jgi:hypothetical protein
MRGSVVSIQNGRRGSIVSTRNEGRGDFSSPEAVSRGEDSSLQSLKRGLNFHQIRYRGRKAFIRFSCLDPYQHVNWLCGRRLATQLDVKLVYGTVENIVQRRTTDDQLQGQ